MDVSVFLHCCALTLGASEWTLHQLGRRGGKGAEVEGRGEQEDLRIGGLWSVLLLSPGAPCPQGGLIGTEASGEREKGAWINVGKGRRISVMI